MKKQIRSVTRSYGNMQDSLRKGICHPEGNEKPLISDGDTKYKHSLFEDNRRTGIGQAEYHEKWSEYNVIGSSFTQIKYKISMELQTQTRYRVSISCVIDRISHNSCRNI